MRAKFKTDGQVWIKATNDIEKSMAHAMTATVRETAREVRDGVRQAIAGAGFGPHWQNSIRSLMLTKGDVLNPAGWVHSTINFADVFETGKHIVGNPLLWLPLPAVPRWPGDPSRQMSPRKFIQVVGPLFTIRRPGKTPLLGTMVNTAATPRRGRHLTKTMLGRFGRSPSAGTTRVMVPLFVGVPAIEIEKRFDFTGVIARADARTEELLQNQMALSVKASGNQDIRSA